MEKAQNKSADTNFLFGGLPPMCGWSFSRVHGHPLKRGVLVKRGPCCGNILGQFEVVASGHCRLIHHTNWAATLYYRCFWTHSHWKFQRKTMFLCWNPWIWNRLHNRGFWLKPLELKLYSSISIQTKCKWIRTIEFIVLLLFKVSILSESFKLGLAKTNKKFTHSRALAWSKFKRYSAQPVFSWLKAHHNANWFRTSIIDQIDLTLVPLDSAFNFTSSRLWNQFVSPFLASHFRSQSRFSAPFPQNSPISFCVTYLQVAPVFKSTWLWYH
jgi:hypothetical protein